MKKLVVLGVLFASVSAPAMAAQTCSRNLSQIWFNQSCAAIAKQNSFRNDGGARSQGVARSAPAAAASAPAASNATGISSVSGRRV
ncbi:MAG: hypothetical protein AAAB35_02170 [Phyllobacterium sp.]|uniref:hypothetical protein n=1 Tax=Phyllobacterium sp. TaxID=1871046 RepID=UPI0030EFCBE0